MNNMYDVLEICLQELEKGADLETVLARYPELANDLRPILKASVMAKSMAVPAPSSDAVRRGRAKLLQRASEMREQKAAPRAKRIIPIFQRLAISFSLATVFLASGTGLVGASSTALPGENLYPVKRSWEGVRLFFTFNPDHKEFLESEFESERLDEVSELLTEGRHETIQYSGVFMHVNGKTYVSGVPVIVPANLQAPVDGVAVTITGRTNAQRFVEIETIELLPDGAVVPVGEPVEVENESDSESNSENSSHSESDSQDVATDSVPTDSAPANEAQSSDTNVSPQPKPQFFEMKGTVESISNNVLIVNGQTVYLDGSMIDGTLTPGATVEIKGYYTQDGRFIVTEVKVKRPRSDSNNNNSDSNNDDSSNNNNDDSHNDDGNNDNQNDNGDD